MSVEKTTRMKGRISNKHGTEADWYAAGTAANPFCPIEGELIIYDPDAIYKHPRTKYGAKDKSGNLIPVHLLPWASGCDESVGLNLYKTLGGDVYVDWGTNTDKVVKIPRGFCGEPVRGITSNGFLRDDETPEVLYIPETMEYISLLTYKNKIPLVYCEAKEAPPNWNRFYESVERVVWGATPDLLELNHKIDQLDKMAIKNLGYLDYNTNITDVYFDGTNAKSGIRYSSTFQTETSEEAIQLYSQGRIPIAPGDKISFEIDEEHKTVKINADNSQADELTIGPDDNIFLGKDGAKFNGVPAFFGNNDCYTEIDEYGNIFQHGGVINGKEITVGENDNISLYSDDFGTILSVTGDNASIVLNGKDVATEEFVNDKIEDLGIGKYVKFTDYATATESGTIKVREGTNGLKMYTNGWIGVSGATNKEITEKLSTTKPIVPSTIDAAVKAGVTTNSIYLTQAEKEKAQKWLGIELNNIIHKQAVSSKLNLTLQDESTVSFLVKLRPSLPYDIEIPMFITYYIPEYDWWVEGYRHFTIPASTFEFQYTLEPEGGMMATDVWFTTDTNMPNFVVNSASFWGKEADYILRYDVNMESTDVYAKQFFTEAGRGEYNEKLYDKVATEKFVLDSLPDVATDDNKTLIVKNGIATEGCTAYAKAGSALGIETYSGSKSFTIWGLGDPSATEGQYGSYLVDGISTTLEDGTTYKMSVGDEYSCHVCFTNADGSTASRQRSFYGKIIYIHSTSQLSPSGDKLYEIGVSPFWGVPANTTFRPFVTNEDGSISELEKEYLDSYGVDQERNTFRIPSKPLLGNRTLGAYAYATGYESSANTRGAFTSGRANIADGNYSAAIGFDNKAAYAAFATGNSTKAIGIKSFTQGANTEAHQEAASAMGVSSIADGYGAQATGIRTRAEGQAANSEGEGTKAIGNANHAEGKNTVAGMKWTKVEKVVESGLYWPRPKNHTIENEFFTGSIDYSKIVLIDAPWSDEWGNVNENGYKLNGYVTITIDSVADRDDLHEYTIAEHVQGAHSDVADFIPLEIGRYEIPVKDYYTSYEVWRPEEYGISYAYCGGFSADKDYVSNGPALILESIDEYVSGDTYSVLQTDYDTSYIDAGKITSIGGNHVCVDKLPVWKDLKYSKGLSDLEIIELSFSEEETSNDIVTSYVNLSSALAYPITILVDSFVGYNNNLYIHEVYDRITIPKDSTRYTLRTHPKRLEYDANSWGDITLPIKYTIKEVEGFPSTTTYEQREDSLTVYDIHEINVATSGRYIGIRTKPHIGQRTLGLGIHAEGNGSQAWYTGAHAGGQNAIASSTFAFAHGAGAKASSRHAIALGDNATANGAFSAAIGQFTKTEKINQIAVGKYNDPTVDKVLFMVGNGTSESDRKNAFYVTSDGKAYAGGKQLLTEAPAVDGLRYTLLGSKNSVDGDAKVILKGDDNSQSAVPIKGSGATKVTTNADGTIVVSSTDTDTTYGVATTSKDGLLSKDDKTYLDKTKSAVAVGAQNSSFLNTANGDHSFATGRGNKALQKSAVATGINTIAYGFNSLTNGDKSIAFGNNSVALGGGTQFTADVSSATGISIRDAWAKGTGYHAALAQDSEVHGRSNLANANKAFVTGWFNRADTENQFVTGKYNDYSSTAALVVGDGSGEKRSNAFEVFGKSDSAPAHANIGGKKVATEEFVTNSLTDYVKNTDYATADTAGVVKVRNETNGLKMYNQGHIGIVKATDEDIVQKSNDTKPIVPNSLDYAVKTSISTNRHTLTDTEKNNAQKWLGVDKAITKAVDEAIKNIETGDSAVEEIKQTSWITLSPEQDEYASFVLEIYPPLPYDLSVPLYKDFGSQDGEYWYESEEWITIPAGDTSYYGQFAPDGSANPDTVSILLNSTYMDEGSDWIYHDRENAEYLTDVYTLIKGNKIHAQQLLVATLDYDDNGNQIFAEVATKKDVDSGYVQKLTPSTSYNNLYGIKPNGEHFGQAMSTDNNEWTVACRIAGGRLVVGDPTQPNHAATKRYIDGLVGDIDTVLDSIIAIQENLIGGET